MRTSFLLLLTSFLVLSRADQSPQCSCWRNFEPKTQVDGDVVCKSLMSRRTMECNIPQRPLCRCPGATGIVFDVAGGDWHCEKINNGNVLKKWDCENKEEIAKFDREHK